MNPSVLLCTAVERVQLSDGYEWRATLESAEPFIKFVTTTRNPLYTPGGKYLVILKPQGEA